MRKFKFIFTMISVFLLIIHLSCSKKQLKVNAPKIRFSIVSTFGVDEAQSEDEKPYQFSFIRSVDCDKEGNIYVLDHKDVCIKVFDKNGKFLREILSQGKGPNEITNPYRLKVNKFRDSLFVLHEHGFQLKEFDLYGDYMNHYSLPEQMTHYFDFFDNSTLIYIAKGKYGEDEYKSMKILDLKSLEIMQEFAPTNIYFLVNGVQRFVYENDIVWTCPGDMMKLVGFDLKTGDIKRQVPINIPYTPYQIIRKELAPGTGSESARIYNFAQPFLVDDFIFIFLTQQKYLENSTEEILPPNGRTIKIYFFENSEVVEAGNFPHFDFFVDIHTTWQNRIIASSSAYDMVPKIVILEAQLE